MKRFLSVILVLCLLMSLTLCAHAEEKRGTIMWLTYSTSGIGYESGYNYLTAICDAMGYDLTIVNGGSLYDATSLLNAVQNGMTDDVVGLITMMDLGLTAVMEQYPDLYVAGFNTAMDTVYGDNPINAAVLENDHFLGTLADGFADGAMTGDQFFDTVLEKGFRKIVTVKFPSYAYPAQTVAETQFLKRMEEYNATAAEEDKIVMVTDPVTQEFSPLPESFFLEDGCDDIDCVVAFCAGITFVYPSMVTAKLNGFCRPDTQLITGGFDNNEDILADVGEGKTIGWINVNPAENPAYAMVLLDNAISGNQFPDFEVERVDGARYIIDSTEDIELVKAKSMLCTGKVELAQLTVDEVLQLTVRFNPDATYAGLKEVFHSEKILMEGLK